MFIVSVFYFVSMHAHVGSFILYACTHTLYTLILSFSGGASPGVELNQTKEQLVVSECRIRHLSGLLSEAERDLAKLTQQNQVLKDEIRRQQRSVEREQHAQNFEYLKNVVLKVGKIKNVAI